MKGKSVRKLMFNLALLLELLLLASRITHNLKTNLILNFACLIVSLFTMIMYTMMMVNTVTIIEIILIFLSYLMNT